MHTARQYHCRTLYIFVKRFDKVFNGDQLQIFDSQDTIQMARMSKWFTKMVHKIPAASNGMNMGLI